MARTFLAVFTSLLLNGVAIPAVAEDSNPAPSNYEIIIADEVRVAYYEAAPRSMAASMRKAVERVCAARPRKSASASKDSDPESIDSWLCGDNPLYFVRGVDVVGHKGKTGFVCEGVRNLKYYAETMFGEGSNCISVSYDYQRKSHYIEIDTE